MSSEQQCWDILKNHFETKGFVEHQTSSFNKFLSTDIAKVIIEEPPIVIESDKETEKLYKKYTILFSNVHIPKPTVIEEDRTLRGFTPCEARQRDLTYDSPIYVNITTILEVEGSEPEIEKFNRVVLGRIPIMLRTCLCYLTEMTPDERVKAGECSKDEGGYFIVRGKERVLIPQIRGSYNEPKVYEQKSGHKFKYIAEIRSMSEETGHSALLKAMIGFDNRTIVFSLPYIKDNIPIGVVFKALGYTQNEEIIDLIGLKSNKTDKYIRLILRDAYLCEEQSDGSSLFMELENNTIEKWKQLDLQEQEKWRQKMTITNALNYIGQFAQHTLKENERENYAKQVIENELFPHIGITATIKEKAYFLGYIVNKLLSTHCGLRKDDDRDDYMNKRVESPGVLCYELFRQLFKKYCQAIVNSMEKKKQIPDAMAIIPRLLIITNGIRHCFGTGNWGVPKNSYIRTGVCQILSRLSYGATISNLRRLTIPIGKESKNTKLRQIHPSQIMYICPCECFDPQTQILMLDGTQKRAADITVKDILVDDVGEPVKVRSTCSGIKNMYDIIPCKSGFTQHRVTDNHILTLKNLKNDTVIDISLEKYLETFGPQADYMVMFKYNSKDYSTFQLKEAGLGPYVGWQLEDPKGRFCLAGGEVVHNTPEGQSIGIVLNLSLLTKISERVSTVLIKEIVGNCDNLISIEEFEGPNQEIKVFLNGILIGITREPFDLVDELKYLRKIKLLPYDVSISYDDMDEEIKIYCDDGRLLRPVFTITGDKLNITTEDGTNWEELINKNLITYVDNNEINSAVVAFTPKELTKYHNDYCEIAPAMMLGVMASIIPFSSNSQSPRNCYQCLHPDELVLMAGGFKKPIKDIVIGDEVVSIDPLTCKESITRVVNQYVKETDKKLIRVVTETGRSLVCTQDHLLLTSVGWVQAQHAQDVAIRQTDYENETKRYFLYSGGDQEKWYRPVKSNYIFIRISQKNHHGGNLIADITTESQNHSFVAGNDFCVHNSSMGKQAMSMFALSHLVRADTVTHVFTCPQKPLVSTKSADMMGFSEMPSGLNAIVAIACYTGKNQEDSVILNKGAVDRGLFWATTYKTHSEEEKKQGTHNFERISVPPLDKRRRDVNYSLLDDEGIIRKTLPKWTDSQGQEHGGDAVYVEVGDAIIGKVLVNSDKVGKEELSDMSLVVKKGEEGYIDRIFTSITPNGYKLVKVVIRTLRVPEVGDKFASRAGQKGTTGEVYPTEDMPYTDSGIIPDIIMNPHAIPSRMTINQLMETVLGKSCCMEGEFGDATPFTSSSDNIAEELCQRLERNGFERTGKEMLYNGFTGEQMGMVFIGPVFYQRLKHLVSEKIHARSTGPTATLTRQPLEGRSRAGGLRFGEMERDAALAHGGVRFLKERLFEQSDKYTVAICDKCGNFATGERLCRACETDKVSHVNMPYVSKLVIQELNAMCIKTKIIAKD